MTRICFLVVAALFSSTLRAQSIVITSSSTPAISAAERQAALQAAGFRMQDNRPIGCDTDPGIRPSQIDVRILDLNGDGLPEALINETNPACYGQPGTAFRLVTRDANGKWRQIAQDVGFPQVLDSKSMGWPDIEIGGPDYGAIPVIGWNGSAYVRKK